MRLTADDALAHLVAHDHGVLSTLHPERGVDTVPCVFAVVGEWLGVPIDRVKPKASLQLQREANLAADPRASLLVEQWHHDDWSQLWWVRAELRWDADAPVEVVDAVVAALSTKYVQYVDRPFERVLIFRVVSVTGWAAS